MKISLAESKHWASTRACVCTVHVLLLECGRDRMQSVCACGGCNNNNEYLERLTRTGPKRLHVLYKYILSKFKAYNMNAHTHTHAHRLARERAHTHTHTHIPPRPHISLYVCLSLPHVCLPASLCSLCVSVCFPPPPDPTPPHPPIPLSVSVCLTLSHLSLPAPLCLVLPASPPTHPAQLPVSLCLSHFTHLLMMMI